MCGSKLVLSQVDLVDTLRSGWYLLEVFIGFSIIIFVHELGHFVLAKLFGVKVETFAIGFGPRLFGIRGRETDYCVRLFPLGGYVKMLGQEDFTLDQERLEATRTDPRSFLAKSPGQKMMIVAGGVVMNIIFAMLVFIVVFMHGLEFPAPLVGRILPGSPAEKAGVQPGDRFVRINGKRVLQFSEVMLAVALSEPGDPIEFEFERNGKIIKKLITPIYNPDVQLPQIGIASAGSLTVLDPGWQFEGEGRLLEGDRIVKVNGIKPRIFFDVERELAEAKGGVVELLVERKEGEDKRLVSVYKRARLMPTRSLFAPSDLKDSIRKVGLERLAVAGLYPRVMVLYPIVDPGGDGKILLQPGDVIVKAGNVANPSGRELQRIFDRFRGATLKIEILRMGAFKEGEDTARIAMDLYIPDSLGEYQLFIDSFSIEQFYPLVAEAEDPMIPAGAILKEISGRNIENWFDVYEVMKANKGRSVDISFLYGSKEYHLRYKVSPDNWDQIMDYGTDIIPKPATVIIRGEYPHQAIMLGIRQTYFTIKTAYVTLQRLAFTRSIGIKQISGPIDIIRRGKQIAEFGGPYRLLYYLALISATLAVMNFLPLPVVDGGVMILLIAEKIKGSPLPARVVAIWQTIGIIAIVALFLFVTYNDILKIISGE